MITALNSALGNGSPDGANRHISNNLANVNTTRLQKDSEPSFKIFFMRPSRNQARTLRRLLSPFGNPTRNGRWRSPVPNATSNKGDLRIPKRDLDCWFEETVFLSFNCLMGKMAYSRDGSFFRSAVGRVETIDGFPVDPEIRHFSQRQEY